MSEFATVEDKGRISTAETNATLTELVSGIIGDSQTLIRQQFAMLRAEIKDDAARATFAGKFMAVGGIGIALGSLLLTIGSIYLVFWLFPGLPLWACWMIVGAPITVLGLTSLLLGWWKVKTEPLVPDKTFHALQENLSWITKRRK